MATELFMDGTDILELDGQALGMESTQQVLRGTITSTSYGNIYFSNIESMPKSIIITYTGRATDNTYLNSYVYSSENTFGYNSTYVNCLVFTSGSALTCTSTPTFNATTKSLNISQAQQTPSGIKSFKKSKEFAYTLVW